MPFGGAERVARQKIIPPVPGKTASPMPFGGAERVASCSPKGSMSAAARHQCLSAERSEWPLQWCAKKHGRRGRSPMPFGGAERVARVGRKAPEGGKPVTNAFRRSGASGLRDDSLHPLDLLNVTNAFRRSGASGRANARGISLPEKCHQCLSAERSEWPPQYAQGYRLPPHRHQCLSAERSEWPAAKS